MTVPRAGLAYFVLVFAAGFALGTARTLWLSPRLGDLAAVAVELPVMLLWSWVACGMVLSRWPVAPGLPRLALGVIAFGLLMAAEALLAAFLSGQTPADWLRGLGTPPGLLGLGGQILFAFIPVLRP